jgi:hypothetical protein
MSFSFQGLKPLSETGILGFEGNGISVHLRQQAKQLQGRKFDAI